MTITLLSTFLLAAGVSNAIAAEYVFLEFYTSSGCNEADAAGTVKAYAIGMCFDKQKMSAGLNGNFTLTQFEDDDCKTEAKVLTSGAVNACGAIDQSVVKSAKITATSPSYDQAISDLSILQGAPLQVFYPDKNCNENASQIVSRINTCVIGGNASVTASTTQQCASPPASKSDSSSYKSCQYTGKSCQGTPQCKDIKFFPGQCFSSSAGSVSYICTYAPSTAKPNKPDNKPVPVSGGVVAAVILIPLVVIIVAVAVFIVIRKSKMSVTTTDTQTGAGQTSYGSV